ncbi:hypothetical protein [Streptacidiphilus sp. MAP12-20]|uniref:hypothetical protein n=1 Tax=Streptacidiphilus sp. MAP12-20 TaxID=3156299 RepID=UPI003514DCEE
MVTALAEAATEAEAVPFRYAVEAASLTVTFCPADVVSVKLEVDTLSTVPDEPPSAGPDRALELPPVALGTAVAEEGGEPTEIPMTAAHVSTAAAIHAPLLLVSWGPAESYSFMMAILQLRKLWKACLPFVRGRFGHPVIRPNLR